VRYIVAVMIAKSVRRFVAQFAVAALVFGQIATTAYACQARGTVAPLAVAHGTAHAGNGPCAGTDESPASAHANACEVHCTDGIGVANPPDLPPVVLTALPASAMPYAESETDTGGPRAPIDPMSGAPPVALRYCRLLI
jgi:hypothetical protein